MVKAARNQQKNRSTGSTYPLLLTYGVITFFFIGLVHLTPGAFAREKAKVVSTDIHRKIKNSLSMEFVFIQPGTFMLGSPGDEIGREADEIQHRVTLTNGFYMGVTEVTRGQWRRVMGNNPSGFKDCGDNCPVEHVSWNDVQEFIFKLNQLEETARYRLPTEAEWEYACRAGTTTLFNTGNCVFTDQANFNGDYPLVRCSRGLYRATTVEVGSFPPNAWGLFDMHGNVWEWCQDKYGKYQADPVSDPAGSLSGTKRAVRGGGWNSVDFTSRSARRNRGAQEDKGNDLGFRLAMDPLKRVMLRSRARKLPEEDVKKMLAKYNFHDHYWNKTGNFENDFTDNGDGTVTDWVTGLMWQKSGSVKDMRHEDAKTYIKRLNRKQFAGHNDWRLPNIEELASLLESRKMNQKLYIDPVFDDKQLWCWSADKCSADSAWLISFYDCHVSELEQNYGFHVRAVRSIQ